MGVLSFIKSLPGRVLGGVHAAGKWIGNHIAPAVSGIANAIHTAAPYAAGALGALGQPGLAAGAAAIGRAAGTVKNYSDKIQNRFGDRPG